MKDIQTVKGKTWQAKKIDDTYILNIDYGAKVMEAIEDLVHVENIQSAEISGIGATNEVTLGFFDFEAQDYTTHTFKEQMEIASALGNIAYKGDELYIHLHVTLGKEDYTTFGGHLIEAKIRGVGEFYIRTNPIKAIKTKVGDSKMWVYNFDV